MKYESAFAYGTSDVLVASSEALDTPDAIARQLEEARRIVEAGDLGRFDEALKLKREALGIDELPPGGEAAWFNLDGELKVDIGVLVGDDQHSASWVGDENYYPLLHATPLARRSSEIATDERRKAIGDPNATVEPLRGNIWNERKAEQEALEAVYAQEGTWREFESYVFMRLGGQLRMAPDGPALRQALQEARIREDEGESLQGIRISFHPSYQMPVERIGHGPRERENWRLHPRVGKVDRYWHEKEYEFALMREAEVRMDDTVAPHQREEALKELPRPEKPGELSPRAEVIVALRAVQNIQDSPLAAQVDPTLLAETVAKVKDNLRLLLEKAAPAQRGEAYDGTNPRDIRGFEGAGDPTQYIPAIGSAAVRLGETLVLDMQGAQDGHTLVYGGEEEVFLPDDGPMEELTPAEKRVVRLALEWQAGSDRPDFRDEAVDMLKHGVMFAGN